MRSQRRFGFTIVYPMRHPKRMILISLGFFWGKLKRVPSVRWLDDIKTPSNPGQYRRFGGLKIYNARTGPPPVRRLFKVILTLCFFATPPVRRFEGCCIWMQSLKEYSRRFGGLKDEYEMIVPGNRSSTGSVA